MTKEFDNPGLNSYIKLYFVMENGAVNSGNRLRGVKKTPTSALSERAAQGRRINFFAQEAEKGFPRSRRSLEKCNKPKSAER